MLVSVCGPAVDPQDAQAHQSMNQSRVMGSCGPLGRRDRSIRWRVRGGSSAATVLQWVVEVFHFDVVEVEVALGFIIRIELKALGETLAILLA